MIPCLCASILLRQFSLESSVADSSSFLDRSTGAGVMLMTTKGPTLIMPIRSFSGLLRLAREEPFPVMRSEDR